MIRHEWFTYSDEQGNEIRTVVRDALGRDADQIKHQVTHYGRTGTLSLLDRIEVAANQYRFYDAFNRQSKRRAELDALRQSAENWRASIISAVTVPLDAKYGVVVPLLMQGSDADMLTATRDYFRKLARNLDRMIEQAGTSRDNARQSKAARDQCWKQLLAIWRELGGKPTGKAAATFLWAASKPVMGSAVPDAPSIRRWLERHR